MACGGIPYLRHAPLRLCRGSRRLDSRLPNRTTPSGCDRCCLPDAPAAFTLWALAVWLPATQASAGPRTGLHVGTLVWTAILFSFSVLAKETAIVWPATLAAVELVFALRTIRDRAVCHEHLRRLAAVAFPVLPLAAWFLYHRLATGFMFGNPEYLRYNATANLTFAHIAQAFRYRFLHLFWQRDIWLPITLALACLFLPRRVPAPRSLEPGILRLIGLLVAANWIFFSVLGGAELTRYLLPVYPLTLMVCFSLWRERSELWPLFTTVTAAAFISALWINPPTSFAPEDNLTYRNMIVVHQQAIDYVAQHYPGATVLTAWPVSADLFRPELGYVKQPIRAYAIENFTRAEIEKAAQVPGEYDTAIVFTTHYTTPAFQTWLLAHPDSRRGREYNATRDLTPAEIAIMLGGRIVFQKDLDGEWAAVLRFPRSYEALLRSDMGTPRLFVQTAASSFGP
jgi:hypothetical protein